MNFEKWFDTFLEEKEIPYILFEIKKNGIIHFIDNQKIIECIKEAPKKEQNKIKDTLVKIDFRNGNINHFFKHLATCYVENFY